MEGIQAQMVFCCAEQWMGGRFHQIEPWGDGLRLDCNRAATGVYCMKAVDSGENGFCWSRAVVEAELPPDTALRVYAYACDTKGWGDWADLDEGIRSREGAPMPALGGVVGRPAAEGRECRVGLAGRALDAGMDGLEVRYATYTPWWEAEAEALCLRRGLLLSGGSDFHGARKPNDLGTGLGGLFVPEDWLAPMEERLRKRAAGPK